MCPLHGTRKGRPFAVLASRFLSFGISHRIESRGAAIRLRVLCETHLGERWLKKGGADVAEYPGTTRLTGRPDCPNFTGHHQAGSRHDVSLLDWA
jgi:hypothetical protein